MIKINIATVALRKDIDSSRDDNRDWCDGRTGSRWSSPSASKSLIIIFSKVSTQRNDLKKIMRSLS